MCVYVADVGYFSFARLSALDSSGRMFVQRLKGGMALLNKKGHHLVLKGLLPQQEGEWITYGVRVGVTAHLPVRLMVVRVPKSVGDERREELHREAKRKGEEVSQEQLELADWTILITNVPASLLSVPEALVLMRHRWQIERLFRRWKDGSQIDEWRTSNPWRILCELYCKLMVDVIVQWVSVASCWQDPARSGASGPQRSPQFSQSLSSRGRVSNHAAMAGTSDPIGVPNESPWRQEECC